MSAVSRERSDSTDLWAEVIQRFQKPYSATLAAMPSSLSPPRHHMTRSCPRSRSFQPRSHRERGEREEREVRAGAQSTRVSQSLTIFSLPDTATADQVSEVVDGAWSLQYMVRGPVCGSAGSIEQGFLPATGGTAANKEKLLGAFNNAVLFRYANADALHGFMSHPKTKLMLDELSSSERASTNGIVSMTFSVDVPNELEAIFRRGDEWEEGVELFVGLHRRASGTQEDAAEFMALINQLATSSAYGALQSGVGDVEAIVHHSLHDESSKKDEVLDLFASDMIYTVRFQDASQLEAFMAAPPLQAILNHDDRAPVALTWGVVQRIVSPEENDKVGKANM
jgi:hypothetical protein